MAAAPSLVESCPVSGPTYDVFLSFCGPDRPFGRKLALQLRTLGLQVFLDEDDIEPFASITDTIAAALSRAKALVAYFSRRYADRPACQQELMSAFLAGQCEGDPCGRIMVINPEPGTDHLRPVHLADAKFLRTHEPVAELALQISKRASELESTIGEVQPRHRAFPALAQRVHLRHFTGRWRELWDLHTALHASDYPMVVEAECGSVAWICGLPGAGKTALATAYAWRFGSAYPGGVQWLSMRTTGSASPAIRSTPESLWVIDDIPEDADLDRIDALLLAAHPSAKVILIGREDVTRGMLPVVRVGPLPLADAVAVLDRYRVPDDVMDSTARELVIRSLGGNAGALTAVGERLMDRQGAESYVSQAAQIDVGPHLDRLLADVRTVIDRMAAPELRLLRAAQASGIRALPLPPPAAISARVGTDVASTLRQLQVRGVARRNGRVWVLDPLVLLVVGRDHD